MNAKKLLSPFIVLTGMFTLAGCVQWKSDFSTWDPSRPPSDAEALLEKAHHLGNQADNKHALLLTIEALEKVLEADPSHYEALIHLSSFYLLLGDGYTDQTAQKVDHFRTALRYSERAMYTHPDFQKRIDKGVPVWEAVDVLTTREMEAMLFWTTAVFYYYKEGLGPVRQTINYRWVTRALRVLERMTELDPDWGGGVIHFTWGVYYLSIPVSVGGDRELSARYFQQAIDVGPNRLLNRWGRAKYFHVKMNNPLLFKEDLQWILAQDMEDADDESAWKAYFIQDARAMLDRFDAYFE